MGRFLSQVHSLTSEPDGTPKLRLSLAPELTLTAGQALLGVRIGDHAPYRHKLYPIKVEGDEWVSHTIPDPAWIPGDTIDILGPIGNGFTPPRKLKRWLLLCYTQQATVFGPLISTGLHAGKELSLWPREESVLLPPQVEVLSAPEAAFEWAEFIAVVCGLENLSEMIEQLKPFQRNGSKTVQVLLDLALPCGFGGCGACAYPTKSGVSLACLVGPIFDMDQLST
jgi:hypothetical protein